MGSFLSQLESLFAIVVVGTLKTIIFFDVAFWDNASGDAIQVPLVVLWLIVGAFYFTLRFQFVNFRAFRHAVDCVRGRYTHPGEAGEISHFQALSAALSATVGLGNIAGVAVAVGLGGPGAVFWMILAGFLGMSSKFAECTLGQKYRHTREDGHVSGGPMHFLRDGLAELGWPRLGTALARDLRRDVHRRKLRRRQHVPVQPGLRADLGRAAVSRGHRRCDRLRAACSRHSSDLVIIGGIKRIGEVAATARPLHVHRLRRLRPVDPGERTPGPSGRLRQSL